MDGVDLGVLLYHDPRTTVHRCLAPPRTWRQHHRPNTLQPGQTSPLADPSKSSPRLRIFTLISLIVYLKQAAVHLDIAPLLFALELLDFSQFVVCRLPRFDTLSVV